MYESGFAKQPVRIVFDVEGELLNLSEQNFIDLNLFKKSSSVVILCSQKIVEEVEKKKHQFAESLPQLTWHCLSNQKDSGFFDQNEVIDFLQNQKIYSLLVEGGAGMYQSLMQQNLIDRIYWFRSSRNVDSDRALRWHPDKDLPSLPFKIELEEDTLFFGSC